MRNKVFLLILILLSCRNTDFIIREVEFKGRKNIGLTEFFDIETELMGKNIFSINMYETTDRIKENIFVKEVNYHIVMPDTIKFEIVEKKMFGFIKKNGVNYGVLEDGVLVQIGEPDGIEFILKTDLDKNYLSSLLKKVEKINIEIKSIKINSNHIELITSDDFTIITDRDLDKMSKMRTAEDLIKNPENYGLKELKGIDLRFKNMIILKSGG